MRMRDHAITTSTIKDQSCRVITDVCSAGSYVLFGSLMSRREGPKRLGSCKMYL